MLEVLARSVMSLYEGGKIRVRIGSEFPEEFEFKAGTYQESELFSVVCDVITELERMVC